MFLSSKMPNNSSTYSLTKLKHHSRTLHLDMSLITSMVAKLAVRWYAQDVEQRKKEHKTSTPFPSPSKDSKMSTNPFLTTLKDKLFRTISVILAKISAMSQREISLKKHQTFS